jgi:hypothetical protein
MCRLYEEVRTRLEEMAMITTRTLKLNTSRGSEVRFCSTRAEGEANLELIELVRTSRESGYYDYFQGACIGFGGAGSEGRLSEKE